MPQKTANIRFGQTDKFWTPCGGSNEHNSFSRSLTTRSVFRCAHSIVLNQK